jgi:hypothetical protein
VIDQTLVAEGLLFTEHRDRCIYLGLWSWQKPQWLKANPGKWRRLEDVQREAASLPAPVESEIDVGAASSGPNGQVSSHDVRKNGDDEDGIASVDVTKTTKAGLLSRAKAAIEAGESLRDVVEVVALAQKDFNASQREIAKAVGRSASWVNRLLKWRRSGYKEYSPFGPTTRAGRVAYSQQRTTASKLQHPKGTTATTPADD